jgi:drug/metabolite transporter (DMT)-like permease
LTGVALALGASLIWGFADFGAGAAARRMPVLVVVVGTQAAGLALAAVVVAASGRGAPGAAQLAWGAFAGVAGGVGLCAFYRGMAVGAMGVVGPITSTAVLVSVGYGLARGERPSTLQGIGVGLAVLGVIGASLERLPREQGRRIGTGVGLSLVAALCFGWAIVGISRAAHGGIAWTVLTMRSTSLPLAAVAAAAAAQRAPSGREWLPLAGVGFGDTGATLLYAAASTRGLLSVISVLASLYSLVIVALARLVLAERMTRAQFAGVAVALAGVALISSG